MFCNLLSSENIVNVVISKDSEYIIQRKEDGKWVLLIHDLIDNNELEMLEKIAKNNKEIQEPCRKIKILYSKLMMFADELMNCVNNIENAAKTMQQPYGFEKARESIFDLIVTAHQDLSNNCFTSHVLATCSGHNDFTIKNIETVRRNILKEETAFAFKKIQFETEIKTKMAELDKKKQEIIELQETQKEAQKKSLAEMESKTKIIIDEMKRESFKQKKAIKNKDKLIDDLQKKISSIENSSQNRKLVGKSVTILTPQTLPSVKLVSERKTTKTFPRIQLFENKVSTKSFEEISLIPKLPAMRPGINIQRRWRSKPPTRRRENCFFDIDLDENLDNFLDFHYQNNSLVKI